MEFELDLVELGEEDEARRRKTSAKRKRASGRGAPGRPKSAKHRSAISAGMKKYWRSKAASMRRRKRKGSKKRKSVTKSKTGTRKKRKYTKRVKTSAPKKAYTPFKPSGKTGSARPKKKVGRK